MDMYEIVKQHPILAILRNVPLEKTLDYADTVVKGGISFFEVALNSRDGLQQIRMLRDHLGDTCMIGAGTAISVDLAKAALDAGAQFLLTPGTPPDVLEYCADQQIYLLPGVLTPCDVALAPHCPLGPIALASCLNIDATCYNAVIQEQSMGIHYNVGKSVLDYVKNPEDFRFENGYVNLPKLPGLGVDVNKELILEENQTPHNWKNPVWRHKDGSIAEWYSRRHP